MDLNFEKNSTISRKRRGAVRYLKIHNHNGHEFVARFFSQFTFCAHCDKFLWGFGKQGYKCRRCSMSVHSHCHAKLTTICTKSDLHNEAASAGDAVNNRNLKIRN